MYDPEYMQYLSCIPVNKTHEGYFSIDPKTKRIKDSDEKKGAGSDDVSAYDLIMKDKERLLSLDPTYSPVRFIFSHSALREGWDNPNIFQICSLRQANSISQKRQEVGRGLRLCVDNKGVRQDADTLQGQVQQINRLTVIASEGYADFVNACRRIFRKISTTVRKLPTSTTSMERLSRLRMAASIVSRRQKPRRFISTW